MKKSETKVRLGFFIICLTVVFHVSAQEASVLSTKGITICEANQPLGVILKKLIVDYDIPIGFEESILDRDHGDYEFETNSPNKRPQTIVGANGQSQISITYEPGFSARSHFFTVNIANGKLEDVLNCIVGQMSNYKWEINEEVVNIFPVQGRDPNFDKLLKLKIKDFRLKQNSRFWMIRDKLLALPEVVKFLNDNKISSGRNRDNFFYLQKQLPVDWNFSNLRFKDLLNRIAKLKSGGWILKQSDSYGPNYIEIEI